MPATFTETITLTRIDCPRCGATYAINERFRAARHEDGRSWHCPYCQGGTNYGLGTNEKLRSELAKTQQELRSSKCETLQERHAREEAERKIKRLDKGVCRCCNRSFVNLARHMKTKHPEGK